MTQPGLSDKILLGIPFYGYASITSLDGRVQAEAITASGYMDVVRAANQSAGKTKLSWDEEAEEHVLELKEVASGGARREAWFPSLAVVAPLLTHSPL